MEITKNLPPGSRRDWRRWWEGNHADQREIWLLMQRPAPLGQLTYLDAVEEALFFGWVDGIAKTHGELTAQRFTPRRKGSNWTELNKERARRLIAGGWMRPAGARVLPDLDPTRFQIPPEIEARLRADPEVWDNFQSFPGLYQRVRVDNIASMVRLPADDERRLSTLIEKTKKKQMFGNWDDSGMARTPPEP
jgi:uncharacterized protein YdeI (YjbR/CyaY-like superfamily)